jgi:hypothetical protein
VARRREARTSAGSSKAVRAPPRSRRRGLLQAAAAQPDDDRPRSGLGSFSIFLKIDFLASGDISSRHQSLTFLCRSMTSDTKDVCFFYLINNIF